MKGLWTWNHNHGSKLKCFKEFDLSVPICSFTAKQTILNKHENCFLAILGLYSSIEPRATPQREVIKTNTKREKGEKHKREV